MFRLLSVFPVLCLLAGPFGLSVADDALASPPAAEAASGQGPGAGQGEAQEAEAVPQGGMKPEADAPEDEELPDDIAAEQDEDEANAESLEGGQQGPGAGMEIMQGLDSDYMEEDESDTKGESNPETQSGEEGRD